MTKYVKIRFTLTSPHIFLPTNIFARFEGLQASCLYMEYKVVF